MIPWDETVDIAIVGSGAAGLCAAIEARQRGASVKVYEKMKVLGGNTRIADGALSAANTYLQHQRGVEDSAEIFYQDMLKAGLGLNHPQLLRIVAQNSAAAIQWTIDRLGVNYRKRLDRFGGHSVARTLTTRGHSGLDITKAQVALLKKAAVDIATRCRLCKLHTDSSGAVCGIQIRSGYRFPEEQSGTINNIRARRAVILATGGFGNDITFRTLQNPVLNEQISSTNHKGATAEGLIAALEIHAAPVQLSWIQTGPWSCADESGYGMGARFASYGVFTAGILVDPASGQRIVNEWGSRRQRSDAIFKTGRACIGIVDALGAEGAAASLQHCLKRGKVKAFKSLKDLSAAYGMPLEEVECTVRTYNQAITRGGRDPLGKPLGQGVQPLSRPPYYGIRLWPKVHYTPGGLGINSRAQVIDLRKRPIPRLFAAGEVCGGIHGASRLGGCALPECIIFGRIAGLEAAGTISGNQG